MLEEGARGTAPAPWAGIGPTSADHRVMITGRGAMRDGRVVGGSAHAEEGTSSRSETANGEYGQDVRRGDQEINDPDERDAGA